MSVRRTKKIRLTTICNNTVAHTFNCVQGSKIQREKILKSVLVLLILSLALSLALCHDLFILQIITICLSGSCLLHKLFFSALLPASFSTLSCMRTLRTFPIWLRHFSLILFDLHTQSEKCTNKHPHRNIYYKHLYVNIFLTSFISLSCFLSPNVSLSPFDKFFLSRFVSVFVRVFKISCLFVPSFVTFAITRIYILYVENAMFAL